MMEYLSWDCNGKWPPSTDKEIKALADNVDHAMDNKRPFRTAVVVFPRDPRSPKLDEVCLLETESICSFPRREPPDRTRWAESVIALMDLVSLFSRRAFPAAPLRPKEAAYRLGETEDGRGKGMFALRELRMGSLLLAERPSVVLPNKEMVYSVKVEGLDEGRVVAVGMERMLECVLERMEEEDKEAYLKLEGKECEVDCPLYGRMLTNGMVVVLREKTSEHHGDPISYCAVFKDISRINHSCGPNATAFFDVQSFSMQLRAVRDIEPGEEIYENWQSNDEKHS
ncbi:hypothetical protein AMATHDRAFT_46347 [Amanita thiersii Skay4041]|uniref:SET domain-containing protein n=1 Tax=Amanita thiersii Skay4041 TaxID=703135 RepID=A0A2A9NT33_9AGAR|nr:hypothetical protein AMATHDRAFT_46347 [Amanita thiersii Skay4041]